MNVAYNQDCIEAMRAMPDGAYDLAVVDPPYGIDFAKTHTGPGWVVREKKDWDKQIPPPEYFKLLFRVSKNQIIWGGNYFTEYLPPSMGWIFWDKGQREFSLADGELAWTSYNRVLRVFDYSRARLNRDRAGFHPTEKPIALYTWIFSKYAKPGDRILDTHLGSGSSRIAAYDAGLDFTGYEIDPDYFTAQEQRFNEHAAQITLFDAGGGALITIIWLAMTPSRAHE